MATEPDRGEWIDLSTREGNARWDELVAADSREPQPLSSYADHRARRRNELALRPYDPTGHRRT